MTLSRNQKGFTSMESAILLIAVVVGASFFAYATLSTGILSTGSASQSASAGASEAMSTVLPKGSMILSEAQSAGVHDGPANALILTDSGAGFIAEGVAAGDTIRNITDGSSGIVDSLTATTITLNPVLSGGVDNDWDVTDVYEVDLDSVGTIRFSMIPSPGIGSVFLPNDATLVFFSDAKNDENATYAAAFPSPLVNNAYWNNTWLEGSGPILDQGETVEFTINVKNLTTPLPANKAFQVQIIPKRGAAITYHRTTPLEITSVMDLN